MHTFETISVESLGDVSGGYDERVAQRTANQWAEVGQRIGGVAGMAGGLGVSALGGIEGLFVAPILVPAGGVVGGVAGAAIGHTAGYAYGAFKTRGQ